MTNKPRSPISGQPVPDGPKFTHETAAERGRAGGKKSGARKRQLKLLREELTMLLAQKTKGTDGKMYTMQQAVSLALIQKAATGDVRAFEVIRDTIGQKPTDTVHVTGEMDGGLMQEIRGLMEPPPAPVEDGGNDA